MLEQNIKAFVWSALLSMTSQECTVIEASENALCMSADELWPNQSVTNSLINDAVNELQICKIFHTKCSQIEIISMNENENINNWS